MYNNYLLKSAQIKDKADQVLKDHHLVEVLKQFGEVYFYGSYELDLMNRHDIDLILVVDQLSFSVVSNLTNILNNKGFNKFWIFDNSKKGWSEDPKHIVVEASFGYYDRNVEEKDKWDVGISICEKAELENALQLTHKVKAAIEKDTSLKEHIVKLKFELAEKHGEHVYRGKAVYDAVLDHGAKNIEDIEKLDTNNY